jgi:quinoprotein glucose dehydrogenase
MQRLFIALALAVAIQQTALAQAIPGAAPESAAALARGEWPAYAGTYASAKYSPLDQIDKSNAGELRVAWRWTSPDQAFRQRSPDIDPSWTNQSTPLMVGGTLYVSTPLSQVAALDAISGQTKWVFNPQVHGEGIPSNNGWLHRGVAYWKSGAEERIILAGAHGIMVALDAQTGKPIPSFGDNGRVDLKRSLRRRPPRGFYTVSSPPVIVRDVIVVGSSIWDTPAYRPMAPGDVLGFDVRTGKLLWTFKTIPEAGEPGVETWDNESWKTTGSANVWAPMSADEELGYVYLPVSTPSNDYYGGQRGGDNLYAESLVCLDASRISCSSSTA